MRFTHRVAIVGKGQHGPFRNDDGSIQIGSEIPYVVVGDGDGDPERATVAQGYDRALLEKLPLMSPVDAVLELYSANGKLKLRFHGLAG